MGGDTPHIAPWLWAPVGRDLGHSMWVGDLWVRQGHADLSPLRAPPGQENTLGYSRRQEMGLAAVRQYGMEQTSALLQPRGRGRGCVLSTPQQPGLPKTVGRSSSPLLSSLPLLITSGLVFLRLAVIPGTPVDFIF